VETAAQIFNEVGHDGTDSNAIARAAGYSPGTFYRHFEDKRGIFLAAYLRYLRGEWERLEEKLASLPDASLELAGALVDGLLAHHRKWRTFRASLRGLQGTDAEVRRILRGSRKQQLELLAGLRARLGSRKRAHEEDLMFLLTLERACDALADGELEEANAGKQRFLKLLLERAQQYLG
jgi:AcrR family transcriptional regulator